MRHLSIFLLILTTVNFTTILADTAIPSTNKRFYTENDTITDNQTRLMWKKCSEGRTGQRCEQGNADTSSFLWSDTARLTRQPFAKYNDWRLPTLQELHSLVRCADGKPSSLKAEARGCAGMDGKGWGKYAIPTIDSKLFPSVPDYAMVWTNTDIANKSGANWLIDFNGGGTNFAYKNNTNRKMVRLVRNIKP